jgi:uncharacterized protein YunC (DUF1805 family)
MESAMSDEVQGVGPTVWHDGGESGRVMFADSLSYFEHDAWLNDVCCGASFAGAPTGAMAMRGGVKGWIAHNGGVGKDEAGISGLPLADKYGIPAAATDTMESGLSVGKSLLVATVSHANLAAQALGVRPGQTGGEAAKLMLAAPKGQKIDFTGIIDESTHEVHSDDNGKIYAVWSSSRVEGHHPKDVFCVASHAGKVMAQYALRVKPKGLIANDGGVGLNDSGVSGLQDLEQIGGIPAAAVSANSARIGDALSTFNDGIISFANGSAKMLGIVPGMAARDAALLMLNAPAREHTS